MSRQRDKDFRGFLKNNHAFYAHHMSHHRGVEVPDRVEEHDLRWVRNALRKTLS